MDLPLKLPISTTTPGAGRTGGEQSKGAEFELADIAGNFAGALPGCVDHGCEVGGQSKV